MASDTQLIFFPIFFPFGFNLLKHLVFTRKADVARNLSCLFFPPRGIYSQKLLRKEIILINEVDSPFLTLPSGLIGKTGVFVR